MILAGNVRDGPGAYPHTLLLRSYGLRFDGFSALPLLAALVAVLASCAAAPADEEGGRARASSTGTARTGTRRTPRTRSWRSSRSSRCRPSSPKSRRYQKDIVAGANLELHDLQHPKFEALRLEIGGNNWAAERPELLWDKARASYAAGDKAQAFFYVGILLHYVQDMGVPAHAFHVIHQSGPKDWDHTELLAFFDFHGDLRAPGPQGPAARRTGRVRRVERWHRARSLQHRVPRRHLSPQVPSAGV